MKHPEDALSNHPYSETCGCPGCQFIWAGLEAFKRGAPPKIGSFEPIHGDIAEDPRYPGFYRTWTGVYWHPRFLLNEQVCICADKSRSHQYGCLVDDSTLPVFSGPKGGKL